jgi:hypothetical protein
MQVISVFRCIVFWAGFYDTTGCRSDSDASTGGQLGILKISVQPAFFFLAETLSRNWNESDRLFLAFWTLPVSPPDYFEV